jgi:hypothetical protein
MRRSAFVPFLKSCVGALLVLAFLLVLAHFVFCEQVGKLQAVADGKKIVLSGVVANVHGVAGEECESIYELNDPTGSVFVVSRNGLPQPDALVVLWGTKTSTDAGRVLVREQRRVGSF